MFISYFSDIPRINHYNLYAETLTSILVVKSMRGAGGRAYLTLNPIETSIDFSMTIITGKKIESK